MFGWSKAELEAEIDKAMAEVDECEKAALRRSVRYLADENARLAARVAELESAILDVIVELLP